MDIRPCGTYHATIETCVTVTMPDGKSAFKVYFVSSTGRDNPERFEWDRCPIDRQRFLQDFRASGRQGIGFVTAFPHITKVFVFPPRAEVLLDVEAFETATGQPLSLERPDGRCEFACLAEAVIANDEFLAWADAPDVPTYLRHAMPPGRADVHSNRKLADHFRD